VSAQHIDNLPLLSTQPPDRFQNRQVSLARAVLFQALPSTDPNAPIRRDAPRERVDQSGLADAGFSGNKYDPTFSSKHLLEPASHPRQRRVASDNSLRGICGMSRKTRNGSVTPDLLISTNKAVASTMCGFNEARRLRIIAENIADFTNDDFKNGLPDKGSWPDGVEKFLFCHELARTPDEVVQHREGFGSELYCL
jgi:hypothetical protein